MAKFWSAEEVEYLEENWGIKSIPNIAKNINILSTNFFTKLKSL